jgi:aminopeptidase N
VKRATHLEVIMIRCIAAAATLLVALLLLPAAAAAIPPTVGAPGSGDPFFPLAGNGGYDVGKYSLALSYQPATHELRGRATVTATAAQALSQFDLDLRGFRVAAVRVDGAPATFWRSGQELVIKPTAAIADGATFRVVVRYAGRPGPVTDPDGSSEGWVPTDDGAFVVGEPQGSPSWFPANDTPRDKALFDIRVTVPRGITVMANGVLVSHKTAGQRTTWLWRETDPMAPYLATATLGRFDLSRSSVDGVPSYVAVDKKMRHRGVLRRLPGIIRFYASEFGPYPFTAVGAVVDRAPQVGYALETQTKPVFDSMPDEATLAHELSHQWYGDSVTLSAWPDIWLHEGFATWCEWLWSEHRGTKSAHDIFAKLYATPTSKTDFWNPPPGAPGTPVHLFDGTIYERGAMTLQALREKVGDQDFFAIMRAWAQDNRYGNVTTAQFIALAEQISGVDLGAFFQAWLYQEGKPAM